jgi:cystathionine gamma-lyase
MKSYDIATRAIHAGQEPDPSTGAIMTPIYATSTYVQESPGKHKGYDYARSINPTRLAYEKCIADLESGTRGWAFASGLAAMATALDALDSGSHVIASDDLYGGTFRLFEKVRRRSANLDFTFVDLTDAANFKKSRHAHGLDRNAEQSAFENHRPRSDLENRARKKDHQRFR